MADTYSFQDQVRDVSPVVDLILKDMPVLFGMIGDGEAARSTKIEYLTDELAPFTDPVASNPFGTSDTTLTVTDGTKFRKDDVIGFEAATGEAFLETVQVTGIVGNNLTVTRQFNTQAKVSIPQGSIAKVVSRPNLENTVGGQDEARDRGRGFNYTEIFVKFATVSRSQMQSLTYGVDDELNYQVDLRLREMILQMERVLLFGHKTAGLATVPRTCGGILDEILNSGSSLKTDVNGALANTHIDDAVEQILSASGLMPNVAVCHPKMAKKISAFDQSGLRVERTDPVSGRAVYGFRSSIPWGSIQNIVVVPQFPKDMILLATTQKILKRYMQKPQDMDATQKGQDGFARKIVSELSFEFKNFEKVHKLLYNINL